MILIEVLIFILVAYILGLLMQQIKLPSILGYLLAGILIGQLYLFNNWTMNILNHLFLITKVALATILLKAGFGISKPVLKKVGSRAILLAFIPNLLEGFTIGFVAKFLLDISYIEGFMLGFIVSAVSPAIIIPSMIKIQEEGYGVKSGLPTMNLASASIDDVVSITMFTFFLNLYLKDRLTYSEFIIQPLMIVNGIIIAILFYNILSIAIQKTSNQYVRILQFTMLMSLLIGLAYFGNAMLINSSIAVIIFGYLFNNRKNEITRYLNQYLNIMWKIVAIILFFVIGARITLNMPLSTWMFGVLIIAMGLLVRLIGSALCLIGSKFSNSERLFNLMCNVPKATVQASLAAIPLVEGVGAGQTILSIAVLSILITAPLGLLLIEKNYKILLSK